MTGDEARRAPRVIVSKKLTAAVTAAAAAAAVALALALAPSASAQIGWQNCGTVGGMNAQAWAPTHTPCWAARDVVRYAERRAVLGGGGSFVLDGLTWHGYWYEGSTITYRIDQLGRWWYSVRAYGHRLPAGAYGE